MVVISNTNTYMIWGAASPLDRTEAETHSDRRENEEGNYNTSQPHYNGKCKCRFN